MRVQLSEIKASTPRVRQSQSPEKLDELAQSIREEGVIVPVKVRKNGDGYTLVYGHRRVAAAKMAGLTEIEAIVEDVPEKKLLTQALIENVVREGMVPIEIAKALAQIMKDTGCTQAELDAKMGWAEGNAGDYLAMLSPELGLNGSKKQGSSPVGTLHVRQAKAGTDNLKDAAKVLKYAAEHGEDGHPLSATSTRQVAEVVRKAAEFGGDKAVARVLSRPYREIEMTAATFEPRKKVAPVVRETPKVHFEWTKDPRVMLAEEGVRAISAVVSAIARSQEDRGGGRAMLKLLRRSVANLLEQLDKVLETWR